MKISWDQTRLLCLKACLYLYYCCLLKDNCKKVWQCGIPLGININKTRLSNNNFLIERSPAADGNKCLRPSNSRLWYGDRGRERKSAEWGYHFMSVAYTAPGLLNTTWSRLFQFCKNFQSNILNFFSLQDIFHERTCVKMLVKLCWMPIFHFSFLSYQQ